MEQIKFNTTGKDITNIKIGDIINYETWCKDSICEENPEYNKWVRTGNILGENEVDWEIIEINKLNNKYIKIKIRRVEPVKTRNKTFYFPKHRMIFNMNGVSKSIYSSSAPGYSWKNVITNIK